MYAVVHLPLLRPPLTLFLHLDAPDEHYNHVNFLSSHLFLSQNLLKHVLIELFQINRIRVLGKPPAFCFYFLLTLLSIGSAAR